MNDGTVFAERVRFSDQGKEQGRMRRCVILQAVWLMMLTATINTKAQEPHVKERARAYEPLIAAAAARHGVDPRLLWTIAYLESRFRPRAVSSKEGKPCAYGMMQFVPATAARYGLVNPHDPAQAINSAALYVRDLTRRFGNDVRLILAAYNSGEGTVEAYRDGRKLVLPTGKIINGALLKTDGVPPYRETQSYVAGGMMIYHTISAQGILSGPHRLLADGKSMPQESAPAAIPDDQPERSLYITTITTPIPTIESNNQLTASPSITRANSPMSPPAAHTRSIYIP